MFLYMPSPAEVSCIKKTFSNSFQFDENIVTKNSGECKRKSCNEINTKQSKDLQDKSKENPSDSKEKRSVDKEISEDPFFFH